MAVSQRLVTSAPLPKVEQPSERRRLLPESKGALELFQAFTCPLKALPEQDAVLRNCV